MTETCRSHRCGAPIIWARSMATGKLMPVDAEPVADGNIVLTEDLLGEITAVIEPGATAPRHKSHFATCPDADRFRRD